MSPSIALPKEEERVRCVARRHAKHARRADRRRASDTRPQKQRGTDGHWHRTNERNEQGTSIGEHKAQKCAIIT